MTWNWPKPPKEEMHNATGRENRSDVSTDDLPRKYHRRLPCGTVIDIYDVLVAWSVTNPADAHAIKKMLMPGKRGHKDAIKDRQEAIASLHRAIEIEQQRAAK